MVGGWPLHIRNLFDRPLSKPWELIIGHEQLLVGKQKPKPVLRNMSKLQPPKWWFQASWISLKCAFKLLALVEAAQQKDQYG